MENALPFYLNHAPDRLPAPAPWPDPAESPVKFARRTLPAARSRGAPAVSHVRLTDFDGDGQLDALATEMQQGVLLTRLIGQRRARADDPGQHPASRSRDAASTSTRTACRICWSPISANSSPCDHDHGAVIWLRGLANGKFGAMWLDGWPRVADVEAGDFNGDGKLDLAVAAFGWRTTGQISVLENQTTNYAQPSVRQPRDRSAPRQHPRRSRSI